MANVMDLIAVKCNYCSRQMVRSRVHQLAAGAQNICDDCLDWHGKALDLLSGTGLPGCQVCLRSWETLRDSTPGVEVRLYVVPKDAILQVLCSACCGAYVAKRADLYQGTRFGATALKL
jgi:hypothetical protein